MSQPMKETFAERLKAFRGKKKLSQDALANELGISRQAIINYEQGKRIPDIDVLAKIIAAYGCSAYYLLGFQNEMNDQYAHMTDSIQLSEDAISWIDLNSGRIETLNNALTNEDFWDYIFILSEITTGAVLIDQFNHRMASDYIDFIKYRAHKHIEAMIEAAWKQGCQNVDKDKLEQARKKWSNESNRYMRMSAKLKQKRENNNGK